MVPKRLDDLAPELVVDIARHLWLGDMSHMAQANRRLHQVLDPFLYHTDALPYNQYALYWAAEHNAPAVADKALRAGTPADPRNGRPDPLARPFGASRALTAEQVKEAGAHKALSTPLAVAASTGSVKIAAMLLKRMAPLDYAGILPSLKTAAENGHGEMVNLLLQYSAHVGADMPTLVEAVFGFAAAEGQRGVLERMLQVRTGPAAVDKDSAYYENGKTLAAAAGYDDVWDLLTAAQPLLRGIPTLDMGLLAVGMPVKGPGSRGILELARELIRLGADVNHPDVSANILSDVCNRNNVPLMELICEHLSDRQMALRHMMLSTTLFLAGSERVEMMTMLLPHLPPMDTHPDVWNVGVQEALSHGMPETARVFLSAMKGSVPPCIPARGYTMLSFACRDALPGVVELLLSMGVSIEHEPDSMLRHTMLQTLMMSGGRDEQRHAIARMLLDAGADPDGLGGSTRPFNISPLMMACEAGLTDVALLLLEHGAKATGKDAGGSTPLHKACGYCVDVRLTEALLEKGADLDARTLGKSTPLHELCLFRRRKRDDNGHDNDNGGASRGSSQRYQVAKVLLAHGADPNAQNINMATPLHYACTATDRPDAEDALVVRALLEHGADMEQRNSRHKTPLFLACSGLNLPVASILLELGADSSSATLRGFAAENTISTAARDEHYLVHGVVKLLLNYGVDRAIMRATLLPVLNSYGRAYETVLLLMMRAGGVDESTTLLLHTEASAARTEALGKALGLVVEDEEEEEDGDDDDDEARSDGLLTTTVLTWPVPNKRNAPKMVDDDEDFLYY